MNTRFFRRAAATAAIGLLAVLCAVSIAAETISQPLETVTLQVPPVAGSSGRLSGPDAADDGTVTMVPGQTYNFTYELETPVTADPQLYGVSCNEALETVMSVEDESSYMFYHLFPVIAADGSTVTFIRPAEGSSFRLVVEFENAYLNTDESGANVTDQPEAVMIPYTSFVGRFSVELRMTADAQATLPLPTPDTWTQQQGSDYLEQVTEALDQPQARLDTPQELVLRLAPFEGTWLFTDYYDGGSLDRQAFSYSSSDIRPADGAPQPSAVWTVEFGGQQSTLDLSSTGLSMNCRLYMQPIDWLPEPLLPAPTDAPAAPDASTGGEIPAGNASGHETAGTGLPGSVGTRLLRNALIAAGAAALGLGISAAGNMLAVSLPQPADDAAAAETQSPTPDLTGPDSPQFSLQITCPFQDLLNSKGAAADLYLTVSGGEAFSWHYLPAAVCPEGLRAVIPSVIGSSHKATLVLSLTGAAMKKPHIPVFITVVAWAAGPDGTLYKVTGNTELTLHQPGLEAVRCPDGTLCVTLYASSNLKGIAEKTLLSPEQYTCAPQPDGSLAITAKPPYSGSCRLEADTQPH